MKKRAELLMVNRTSVYYQKKRVEDVDLMNEIRELYEEKSFYGYRRITEVLKRRGKTINRKKVLRLMQKMGLQAVYPKKNLSRKKEGHKVYPYLLKKQPPKEVDDCWQVDITYIRIGNGYAYLVGLIDCVSRRIMGWSLSAFLETRSCIEALNQALTESVPKMVNSDQGCQFTSGMWIQALEEEKIAISMDGKGRCLDNIKIERFWRSIKYEEVYLKSYESIAEAKKGIREYISFYNKERLHQSLSYQTPDEVYWEQRTSKSVAI